MVLTLAIFIAACKNDTQDDLTQDKEKGWTPIDTQLTDDEPLPSVTEPKPEADSTLSSFLPSKIYDYLGDDEIQNANNKTNTGVTIKSVVRVYRKKDLMIGINVSDLSLLSPKERTDIFEYSHKTLSKLSKKGDKLQHLKADSSIRGKVFWSKRLQKSIMVLVVSDELLVNISSDTHLTLDQFKNIPKLIDFKKLKKLQQIS